MIILFVLVMFMKMEVYLFDPFEIISNRFMRVHFFVKQKMQLEVSKQHLFNLNHVSVCVCVCEKFIVK